MKCISVFCFKISALYYLYYEMLLYKLIHVLIITAIKQKSDSETCQMFELFALKDSWSEFIPEHANDGYVYKRNLIALSYDCLMKCVHVAYYYKQNKYRNYY